MITAGWSLTLCVCSFQGSVGAHTGNLINALATFGVGHVEKIVMIMILLRRKLRGLKENLGKI